MSGPLKERTAAGTITFNLNVSNSAPYHVRGSTLEENVNKLWDLETVGIRKEKSMHEPLFNNISFNGTVRLPSKKDHRELPTNFSTSCYRLKSLLGRLRHESETLREYDIVIMEQLEPVS